MEGTVSGKARFQAVAAAKLDWEVWWGWVGLWYTSDMGSGWSLGLLLKSRNSE